MTRFAPLVIALAALGLSACTNPYDPVQRGLGGGILGAASGAAIGAAAGGGPGAALGAAIGAATGIFGGVASTPPPPPGIYFGYPAYGYPAYPSPVYGYPGYAQPGYGYPGYSGYPPTPVPRLLDTPMPDTRPTPVLHAMATRADRHTLPIPVPGTEVPWLVISAIALWRTGRLEPGTRSSLLAEFRPDTKSSPRLRRRVEIAE